jgi:ATP-dependent helicase/nuclease subunit A
MSERATLNSDAQRLGADPSASVSLLASAGAGKTTVLCERFLNLVASGALPEKILCITYTKSAAREMLERILAQSQQTDYYQKIIACKHRLKIQTIHSFCLEMVARHSDKSGFPRRQLINTSLRFHTLNNILDGVLYSSMREALQNSVTELSSSFAISTIKQRIISVISNEGNALRVYFSQHNGDPQHIKSRIFSLHDAHEEYDYPSKCREILNHITRYGLQQIEHQDIAKLEEAVQVLNSQNYEAIRALCLTQEDKTRKFITKAMLQKHPTTSQIIMEIQQQVYEHEKAYSFHMCAKRNWAFITLTQEVLEHYITFKQQHYLMDYDDIIQDATNLIASDPEILYQLDYEIDHILLDEAQDLSTYQWDFIRHISEEFFAGTGAQNRNRTVFFVGDTKQSIFSFQGADPQLLVHYSHYFKKLVLMVGKWHDVALNLSYRSEPNIVALVNKIFNTTMQDFPQHIAHKNGIGQIKVWPLIKVNEIGQNTDGQKTSMWQMPSKELDSMDLEVQLASEIATMVHKWVTQGRKLLGSNQVILPSDIMILVRKRSRYVDILAAKLRGLGLKVNTPIHGKFTDYLVVQDVMALVEFFLNPDDELNLAGLLKSPWFGYTEKQLRDACHGRVKSLLENLVEHDVQAYERLCYFHNMRKQYTTLYALLHHLLFVEAYVDGFINFFGSECMRYLDHLLEGIHEYENKNISGNLRQLIEYIEFYHPQNTVHKSKDTIEIMTVHAAKGLQAPIVILADATAQGAGPNNDGVYFTLGELYFSPGGRHKSDAYNNILLYEAYKREQEDMRLLYVALTRAESELHVFGAKKSANAGNWYNIIEQHLGGDENWEECYAATVSEAPQTSTAFLYLNHHVRSVKLGGSDLSTQKEILAGEIVHAILEKLDLLSSEIQRHSYQKVLRRKYGRDFDEADLNALWDEALNVYHHFPQFFGKKNIMSEQSIAVLDGVGNVALLRMDKVIAQDDEIIVLDFKTDATVPTTMDAVRVEYKEQIERYLKHMKNIFPNKVIAGYLLWTKDLKLILMQKI